MGIIKELSFTYKCAPQVYDMQHLTNAEKGNLFLFMIQSCFMFNKLTNAADILLL